MQGHKKKVPVRNALRSDPRLRNDCYSLECERLVDRHRLVE
jgi:hypothetical protein